MNDLFLLLVVNTRQPQVALTACNFSNWSWIRASPRYLCANSTSVTAEGNTPNPNTSVRVLLQELAMNATELRNLFSRASVVVLEEKPRMGCPMRSASFFLIVLAHPFLDSWINNLSANDEEGTWRVFPTITQWQLVKKKKKKELLPVKGRPGQKEGSRRFARCPLSNPRWEWLTDWLLLDISLSVEMRSRAKHHLPKHK